MREVTTCLFLVSLIHPSISHGVMYHPLPWHSTTRPGPEKGPGAVKYDLRVPLPEEHCQGTGFVHWKIKADCRFHLDNGKGWFSNYTRRDTALAPEATISRDMFDQWTLEKFEKRSLTNPWSAPGSAPIYGSCGTDGGNPYGCGPDGTNPHPVYGSCCGGDCGGWEGGRSAISHAEEGLFDGAPTTTWTRGTPADVYWIQGAEHRGGYAYRLCKIPILPGPPRHFNMGGLTEECFNNGHLNFHGESTWIYKKSYNQFDPQKWVERPAVRTREGTFPVGSQWAKIDLPQDTEGGSAWAFWDKVEVPADIEPGQYVLSFRWDCQKSPQIWSSCANINIV